jgi:hypothetical protein
MDAKTFIQKKNAEAKDALAAIEAEYTSRRAAATAQIALLGQWMQEMGVSSLDSAEPEIKAESKSKFKIEEPVQPVVAQEIIEEPVAVVLPVAEVEEAVIELPDVKIEEPVAESAPVEEVEVPEIVLLPEPKMEEQPEVKIEAPVAMMESESKFEEPAGVMDSEIDFEEPVYEKPVYVSKSFKTDVPEVVLRRIVGEPTLILEEPIQTQRTAASWRSSRDLSPRARAS